MKNRQFSEAETNQYAELFLLAHLQLAAIQRQLGGGMGFWQRRNFRSRHERIRHRLRELIRLKGGDGEETDKSIEEDMAFMANGKKGWSYVSAGQIEYLQGVLKGL